MKGNLKKKIPRTPEKLHPMVLEDITRLHYCRNQIEFQMNLQNVWTKWSQYQDLSNFLNYFWDQWIINSRSNKWQIYHTPPVYASTYNPTESSLNKEIKGTYSNYEQQSMLGVLGLMHKIILDCSESQKVPFENRLMRDNSIAKEARDLSKNDLTFVGENTCYYKFDTATNTYKY